MRANVVLPTGFVKHGSENGVAKVVAEGGVDFRYCNIGPEGGPTEDGFLAGADATDAAHS